MTKSESKEVQALLKDIDAVKRGVGGKIWTPEQLTVLTVRTGLDMTQREFARLLGVPVGTIRDWEQGRKQPDSAARTLIKVARDYPDVLRKLAA